VRSRFDGTVGVANAILPAVVKLKRFVVDRIVEPAIPLRRLEAYVVFWARMVYRLRKPFIVGVTGSVGKSTTTAMIATALSHPRLRARVGRVGQTRDNMNDDVGAAATLLRYERFFILPWSYPRRVATLLTMPFRALRVALSRYPDVMVMEFGVGATSHFRRLVRIAPPSVAIVTCIGPAHLELFGNVDDIAREKGELVKAVPPGGLVALGNDHDRVAMLQAMACAPVVTVSGKGLELSRRLTHVVCRHMGLEEAAVDEALASFASPKGRLNLVRLRCITLLDDSYNANPLSMALGLDTLAQSAAAGQRRVAILGYMAELGDDAVRYHDEVGLHARGCSDLLVGVGPDARRYRPDRWFATSAECAAAIDGILRHGDWVLVKGSFSAQMEKVVWSVKSFGERGASDAKRAA